MIFAFSAKDADESGQASYSTGLMIGRIVVSGFEEMSVEEQQEFAGKIEYPVRKTAHATEYAILGFLVLGAVYSSRMRWYINGLIAWGIAVLYAASDEFHQLFVPGRSGEVRDVCIDGGGALIGVLAGIAIFGGYYKRRSQKAVP